MDRSKDIIVGVDGSAESRSALAWAVADARARRCGVVVVHVCEARDYGLWTTTKGLRAGLREMARPIVDDALALAARIDSAVPARGGVLVGSPTRTLVRLSSFAPVVVIGRNGRGAVSRLLLGSVTQHLAANAHCPVVAVGHPSRGQAAGTVERVVAAIVASPGNDETLQFAFAEAVRRISPLVVLHVLDGTNLPTQQEQTRCGRELIGWRDQYPAAHVTSVVRTGSVVEVIASICVPGDLLVLGHHRRLCLAHHSLRAGTMAALHAAPCPVAVVHEPFEVPVRESVPSLTQAAPAT